MPFLFVHHRDPLPPLMYQGQPRACMMCYCGCSCHCSAAARVLLLCTCYCCAGLLLLLLCLRYVFAANSRENCYLAKSPPLGDVSPHLEVERRTHLLRKRFEYRLLTDICLASLRRSHTSVGFVRYVPVHYAAAAAAAAEFAAPTQSPALCTAE